MTTLHLTVSIASDLLRDLLPGLFTQDIDIASSERQVFPPGVAVSDAGFHVHIQEPARFRVYYMNGVARMVDERTEQSQLFVDLPLPPG